MVKKCKIDIKEIRFRKTSDPMISAGIVGLYKYCCKRKDVKNDFDFIIEGNDLIIKSDTLENVLSELYYEMGKDFYDTSTKNQIERNDGFYYDENNDNIVSYPKVQQRGWAGLIQKGHASSKSKSQKLKDIKRDNILLYQKIIDFCKIKRIKPGSTIYFNDKNTVIPKLEILNIEKGNNNCIICGDSVKKSFESINFSPFIGGINAGSNYVSMLKGAETICWKCVYLQRFSPACSYYIDSAKNSSIYCFIVNTDKLKKLIEIDKILDMHYHKDKLIESNYNQNFDLYNFSREKKKDYYTHFYEILFMFLYTIFKNLARIKPEYSEIDSIMGFEKEILFNTDVFYLNSKDFGGSKRPVASDIFSDFYYIFTLYDLLEKLNPTNKFFIEHLLWDLKSYSDEDQTVLRNKWAEKVIKQQSNISIIEHISMRNFSDKKYTGNFYNLLIWSKLYESLIKYGGNKMMTDEERDLAIKLGTQIGMAAKMDENSTAGKGKLISLRKCRKLNQFLEVIMSFQMRYDIIVNKEILTKINEQNFDYFRQFTIISALNKFNSNKNHEGGSENE